jgi:sugar/nucleoside kinase (ribokinase family)
VVDATGAGDAFVSEMLATGRGTLESPEIDGDTMDAASI